MKVTAGYLVLQNQGARLTLDPERGGVIREFTWWGRNVLRPTPADRGDDPFDSACFPMVPYVNRVAGGQFTFGDRHVRLERNWNEDPHPLHGQGWRAPWKVVAASAAGAVVRFDGGGNEWPWRYSSEQRFQLQESGLWVELSVRNLSDTPMPAMLGLHPYFPDAGHAYLQARLPRVWLTDSQMLPVKQTDTPPDWSFATGRAVQGVALDNGFSDWDGVARLRWPDHTCTVSATNCGFLHVYTPPGRNFFCIEPQSAAPGALTRSGNEATVIPPGDDFSIRVHFAAGAS